MACIVENFVPNVEQSVKVQNKYFPTSIKIHHSFQSVERSPIFEYFKDASKLVKNRTVVIYDLYLSLSERKSSVKQLIVCQILKII